MEKEIWRLGPPTEKQVSAIIKMSVALGENVDIPKTKGECSDLIGALKKVIENHLQVAGMINTKNYDPDDDSMDFMNNDTF